MAKAIHYLHPGTVDHACRLGDPNTIEVTDKLDEVTCRACLRSEVARRSGGRPPAPEGENKIRTTVTISPSLKKEAQGMGLNLSALLEAAIVQQLRPQQPTPPIEESINQFLNSLKPKQRGLAFQWFEKFKKFIRES